MNAFSPLQNLRYAEITPAASELWNDGYVALSQGREDAFGAATSRAEAQVLRLSAIYAALDRTPLIDACHLQAALAVWDYCRASARLLFDTAPIDPSAQRIGQALDAFPWRLETNKSLFCAAIWWNLNELAKVAGSFWFVIGAAYLAAPNQGISSSSKDDRFQLVSVRSAWGLSRYSVWSERAGSPDAALRAGKKLAPNATRQTIAATPK